MAENRELTCLLLCQGSQTACWYSSHLFLMLLCTFHQKPQIIQNTRPSEQYMCWYAWGEIHGYLSLTFEVSKMQLGVMDGDRKQEQRMFTVTSRRWGSLAVFQLFY